jgi:uncharacterized membrane protein YebE (DUF533 family)
MKWTILGVVLALGLLAAAPAQAKGHQGRGFRAKLAQLSAEGKLSPEEHRLLKREHRELKRMKRAAKADGAISPKEKREVRLAKKKLRRDLELAARS